MITPVLLCGGSGTRLWPLSRKSYPKQFADIIGHESLFQASARRFRGAEFGDPLVVTNDSFRFIVTEQLDECGIAPAGILIEPEGRNTAPAAVAAALHLVRRDPEAMLVLVPSDHAVADPDLFREAVLRGAVAAQEGQIVTFGIVPERAETGYGWLESGAETHPGVHRLERFIEKPQQARADELFADKRYLWNAGVFLARAQTLIDAFRDHAPDILDAVQPTLDDAVADLGFTRIDPEGWARVRDESIDYAVMEKAGNVSAVRFDGKWSDLGSWESVWRESTQDETGNALSENTTAFHCENTLLRSESDEVELVGIGLKNVVAVAMRDAVMVADISEAQNVKMAVSTLKARGAKQAVQLPVDHRPWGWFETLVLADRFQVKRIHVHPGAALSLQSHMHRSEHWIVVQGTARVTVDDDVRLLSENESVYIPLGAVHRMENPGKVPMVLIEVQTGAYLGEDDILRYEDVYARK
ncbi:mannose-1-phosphate guanylyltransferase/mannose-1-phosphate guanylyltransferase / mannose-6-phosphate isomerase [Lutimaribacter pacificus]|uniref:mannose-1-phosphate guanylyltransferase n=1 Tax=Lutimaribacter pacificus TaxID=391948 RepID=A0A1H0CPZ2_9RHOB|nr:mannose-1-phosphate guanylyltransferase/mannose-6-phosphate isomerase [Lutimaribacter pacificus]SDN59987.1 mannose-1-phosphate guanylyltransferase/mannose-1-phosphate guanylyltransferase / mannose-6-phosphate isomerase [Lutimaribacter pacificus]SHJ42068.1 mannose-1-phosphate guanylyltransferase/mannose-1-phosphate guanylyltransferase / mannose-6-phosphate isomerase [Lutimaribacter pacificus]